MLKGCLRGTGSTRRGRGSETGKGEKPHKEVKQQVTVSTGFRLHGDSEESPTRGARKMGRLVHYLPFSSITWMPWPGPGAA